MSGQIGNQFTQVQTHRRPALRFVDRKSPLVVSVIAARPDALLIQVFVRHDDQHLSARLQHLPPAFKRAARIRQVFQTVAGIDPIKLGGRETGQLLGITLSLVLGKTIRRHRIVAASDIYPLPDKNGLKITFRLPARSAFARPLFPFALLAFR